MVTLVKPFQRKYALTAGIALIIMALTAAFSYGYVQGNLVLVNDASTTFNNIMSSNMLFNAGIFGWFVIFICDVIVAWALYMFLRPVNKNLSLLGALLRLTYTALLGAAILNLIFVSLLTSGADYVDLLGDQQRQAFTLLFLEAFQLIWSIGLVIFGGHLIVIGYLAFHTKRIPKIISILLMIAAVGYVVIHLFSTFLPHFDVMINVLNIVFTVPMILGELGYALWLLFQGGKKRLAED